MLQRMQPESGVSSGLFMTDNAEDAAFLMQFVVFNGATTPDGCHRRV